jgi:hypothetical protein
MALDFDEASHTYRLDGRPVPSVTQVLDPLMVWDGIPPDVLELARVRGGYVHEACDLLDRGQLDWATLDPALVPYVEGYQNWLADSDVTIVASELRVCHRPLRYAGTLDRLAMLRDALCLVDIKATAVVPLTVGPQTAAYLEATKETSGAKVRRRHCLHLNPKHPRGYKLHALTEPGDFSVFVSALNVYNWRQRHAA